MLNESKNISLDFMSKNTLYNLTEKSIEPSEKTLDLTEKSIEPSEKTLDLTEKTLDLTEKTLDLTEKTLDLTEKTLDLTEKTLDLTEKSIEPSEKTLDLIEKSLTPLENTLDNLTEKSIEPSEKTLDLTEKSLTPSENTLDNLTEKSIEPSEKTLDLTEKSIEPSENTLDNLTEKSIEPSEKTLDNLTEKSLEPLNDDITCLCLSGGGVRGLCFIGVLEKLIEHNKIELNKIDMYVGASIGSIITFFLILGVSIEEIKEFIITFNFFKLNEEIDCINLIEKFGINNGEKVKLLFSKFLELKLNVKDITFKELFNKIQKKILIVGTNLTKCQEELFSVDTSPDMSVITALRISISIPIIFTPVIYNNSVYVDGGLVNNFPINYCPKDKTFGIYTNNCNSFEINSIQSILTACTNVIANIISQKNLNYKYKNIIKIVYTDQLLSILDATQEKKKYMFEIGYKTACEFLNQDI